MKTYTGNSVLKGIAIGNIYKYQKNNAKAERKAIIDIAGELDRFEDALEVAKGQLEILYREAVNHVGAEQAFIFDIHKMMLEDEDYLSCIRQSITQGINAEYAVQTAGKKFEELFASMDDEYMKARAVDMKDISDRVLSVLMGTAGDEITAKGPVIVIADDLTPSETVKMDKSKILAFVTIKGSLNSHTAILARSMNIPSLVNTSLLFEEISDGMLAVVDGFTGKLIVNPDEKVYAEMLQKQENWHLEEAEYKLLKGKENVTTGGKSIEIYANIGNVSDIDSVIESDAGGIGLFRSEFLYLGREDFPSEEEQYRCYKKVIDAMDGKKVIIRTLDIGADKKADYFQLESEENPALGYRAIRICLDKPEIFETQLRAIYRAAAGAKVGIMFPMIISIEEITRIKEIVTRVKEDLKREGYQIGEAELGIMVETPAAALMADELAKEVDFFSIGTNDLTQYTLAIDRQNPKLEKYCDTHHPAVLRLIRMITESAHKASIWVGICGELAGDTDLTATFLDMGIDELSVSPSLVLRVRGAVRKI